MLVTCFSTARIGHEHALGDRLVRAALGHQLEHLALARSQLGQRVVAPAAADELRDDRRIERRAALGDAANRGRELVDVGDPVLEQVADALGALARAARARSPTRRTARARARRCPGCFSRISAAARRPSSVCVGGMRMSTIATSGEYDPHLQHQVVGSRRSGRRCRSRRPRAAARCPPAAGPSRLRARRAASSPRRRGRAERREVLEAARRAAGGSAPARRRPRSSCSPRSRARRVPSSCVPRPPARAAPGRRACLRRCARRDGRRCRSSRRPRPSARRCGCPSARAARALRPRVAGDAPLDLDERPGAASRASSNATKNSSPRQSTTWPPPRSTASRTESPVVGEHGAVRVAEPARELVSSLRYR